MPASKKRNPKSTDPYASLDALVDPDDHETKRWIRECSWSIEAKREMLLEERKLGLKEAMASHQLREIADLKTRMRKLEREQKTMPDQIAKGFAMALKDFGYMSFKGTWDHDQTYNKGAVCVHDGASWVALTSTIKGAKPGRAPEWKMTAKGEGR